MPKFDIAVLNKQVIADAWNEYEKVTDNLNSLWMQKLSRVREELGEKAFREITDETAQTRDKGLKQVGEVSYTNKRSLINRRAEMEKEIFERVKEKLDDFCRGGEYKVYFKNRLKKACGSFGRESLTLMVKPSDVELAGKTAGELGISCAVEADKSISFGGFRLCRPERGLVYDETMDFDLIQQRERFKQMSSLTIN